MGTLRANLRLLFQPISAYKDWYFITWNAISARILIQENVELSDEWGNLMNMDYLKQSYRDLLVSSGICSKKATQACEDVTYDDLKIISEIWPDWGSIFRNQDTANALT
jgi:hypothetical protein